MTKEEKQNLEEKDIIDEMQEEINEIENEDWEIDQDKLNEALNPELVDQIDENTLLAKVMADFDNYKKRVERDKHEMVFFLKQDILKNILPRVDDMERIIKNTPDDLKWNPIYEWVVSMHSKILSDLWKMWVIAFESVWNQVNPDKHDVMTTVPWKESWIIFDEFEKWYMLNDKVLRHAKVIVWL